MNTFSPSSFGAETMEALATANTEALASWTALCKETWLRAAAVRNPLEYAAIGSLMLPACASQAMLYCKRISDIAAGAHAVHSMPLSAPETAKPAASIGLSLNGSSSPAATDSPDLTHTQTPPVKNPAKQSIAAPRFRGD